MAPLKFKEWDKYFWLIKLKEYGIIMQHAKFILLTLCHHTVLTKSVLLHTGEVHCKYAKGAGLILSAPPLCVE